MPQNKKDMNPKIKTYVLMVSTKFPAYHFLNGEPTLFIEKIASGEKITSIRFNYELWRKRFEKINKGEAVLSVRSWEGKPYRSKQIKNFLYGFIFLNLYMLNVRDFDALYMGCHLLLALAIHFSEEIYNFL